MDLSSLLSGGLAGSLIVWLIKRDRNRVDVDRNEDRAQIQRVWNELDAVKKEQACLRERIAAMPTREDFQRLEARLEQKLDELTRVVLKALSTK